MTTPASVTGLAFVSACGAGVLWGTGALVVNLLVEKHGFTPANISFWRFVVGAVVLLAVFGRQIAWARLRPLLGTVLMAGVAMAGYVLLWFLGIGQMGAAVPTLIALCLPPVIVTALTIATLLEPLTAVVLSAVLLGQHLNAIQWFGGALLLLSIWVLATRRTL